MTTEIHPLEAAFNKFQESLRQAAETLTKEVFPGGEDQNPVCAKARYEAVTKIEEAHMWAANGIQALFQLEEKAEQAASDMAQRPDGPDLKVL